jgi:dephospho-CoA kinase
MIVIGLTGSIAMGKSETARMFREEGVPVFDSDACVHELYRDGGDAVAPIAKVFPEVIVNGAVDRGRLTEAAAKHPSDLQRLEAIVHPLVREAQDRFVARWRSAKQPLVLLDIPLLFETGRDRDVDFTVVVSAPPAVQRERALARPGMTEEKFAMISARQMPDEEKRRRADRVIDTSRGLDAARAEVRAIIEELKQRAGACDARNYTRH